VNLEDKKKIVQDLSERFSKAAVVIVTDYKGLDVAAINDLRRRLRKEEIEYQVVKNSLMVRASQETDVALIKETFKGPSAVAMSYSDPIAPAKVLELNEIKALSALPSREVLLGTFVSVLNNVPTAFVRTIAEIPRSLLNVLQAVRDQKEAA
jgi:large subunit ribosomal protein L10